MRLQFRYLNNCVNTPESDRDALLRMVEQAEPVSRDCFTRRVDKADRLQLEKELGYADHASRGLMMGADQHVRYYKSTWKGLPAYFLRWSAIEYYFVGKAY